LLRLGNRVAEFNFGGNKQMFNRPGLSQ
jgi:hypothetical protein